MSESSGSHGYAGRCTECECLITQNRHLRWGWLHEPGKDDHRPDDPRRAGERRRSHANVASRIGAATSRRGAPRRDGPGRDRGLGLARGGVEGLGVRVGIERGAQADAHVVGHARRVQPQPALAEAGEGRVQVLAERGFVADGVPAVLLAPRPPGFVERAGRARSPGDRPRTGRGGMRRWGWRGLPWRPAGRGRCGAG